MKIRDRIVDLRRVKASELMPNPKYWRTHPESQANAMRGLLAEIGIVDAVLARETPDGLMLIDGHLRAELDPEAEWPVIVLDINDKEADQLLATFDTMTGLAATDVGKLEDLLTDLDDFASKDVNDMLNRLAVESGLAVTDWDGGSVVDADAIGDYDPDGEIALIRISLARDGHVAAVKIVEDALNAKEINYAIKVL